MSASKGSNNLDKLDPQERLKFVINYVNMVKVDPNVPPRWYYRSGMEMVKMANVYLDEGNLENAYVLYLKFMTIFLEKIRDHPDINKVPTEVKARNQALLKEVLVKAEKLKPRLMQQYTDEYNKYVGEIKEKERERNEQARRQREKEKEKEAARSKKLPSIEPKNFVTAKPAAAIDDVSYPDPNAPSAPPPDTPSPVKPSSVPATIAGAKIVPSIPLVPQVPSFDRSKKPSETSNDNFDRDVLRPVVVPQKVIVVFQAVAQPNTAKNIETCAVLAGKLEKSELIITHMILPKQKGTSDSCITLNEEEIFDYQDQLNLITIGWIHTHPTQTAFLSSVDLHTHCSYQLLMPEAIAIVCAPKYNQTGFFVLTPFYGLQYISNCRQTGFHPHPTDPPLFTTAEHVRIDASAPLDVLDLRI